MLLPYVESGLLAGALPYVRFGKGEKHLVISPGIGDALEAVTASPRSQAWFFRRFGRTFTAYLIGRKRNLPPRFPKSTQVGITSLHGLHSFCSYFPLAAQGRAWPA